MAPLKLIDFINPGIEIALERAFSKRFSSQVSLVYLKDIIGLSLLDNFRGYRIGVEEKYFFYPYESRKYLSTEFIFSNARYEDGNYFSSDPELAFYEPDSTAYWDDFSVHKQLFILNAKAGIQKIINHLVLDFSFGLGIKYKNVKHFDRINSNDTMKGPRHPNVYYYASIEGEQFTVSFPLSIKVGYTF